MSVFWGEERSGNVAVGAQLKRRFSEHRTEGSPASTAPTVLTRA